MFNAIARFFHDIGHDLAEAIRWFFSPDAWRIVAIVALSIGILVAVGYVGIESTSYSREAFSRCPTSKNLVFMAEFFSFTFFALFSLAAIGEMINWVDAKRKGEGSGRLTAFFIHGSLAAVCGITALTVLIRCS